MELAKINNQTMAIKEYKGQRVLTFGDIDKAHKAATGKARKRFNDNRKRFIEGVDFFKLQPSENRTFGIKSPNGAILITESGYLMLAKSFTDELAWTVQRQLVNCYFRCKSAVQTATTTPTKGEQLTLETSEYHYFDKTYNGEPVITLADFEYFTGVSPDCALHILKKYCTPALDYRKLSGAELLDFKRENPQYNRGVSCVTVVKKSGFISLMKYYGCKANTPKCFIEEAADTRIRIDNDKWTRTADRIQFLLDRFSGIKEVLRLPKGSLMYQEQLDNYKMLINDEIENLSHSCLKSIDRL